MGPVKTVLYLYLSVLKVNTLDNPKPFKKFAQQGSLAIAKYLSDMPDKAQAMKQATLMLEKKLDSMLSLKGKEDEAWKDYLLASRFVDLCTFVEDTPMDEAVSLVRVLKDSDGDVSTPVLADYSRKAFEYTIESSNEQIKAITQVMRRAIEEAAKGEENTPDDVPGDDTSTTHDDQANG